MCIKRIKEDGRRMIGVYIYSREDGWLEFSVRLSTHFESGTFDAPPTNR